MTLRASLLLLNALPPPDAGLLTCLVGFFSSSSSSSSSSFSDTLSLELLPDGGGAPRLRAPLFETAVSADFLFVLFGGRPLLRLSALSDTIVSEGFFNFRVAFLLTFFCSLSDSCESLHELSSSSPSEVSPLKINAFSLVENDSFSHYAPQVPRCGRHRAPNF